MQNDSRFLIRSDPSEAAAEPHLSGPGGKRSETPEETSSRDEGEIETFPAAQKLSKLTGRKRQRDRSDAGQQGRGTVNRKDFENYLNLQKRKRATR